MKAGGEEGDERKMVELGLRVINRLLLTKSEPVGSLSLCAAAVALKEAAEWEVPVELEVEVLQS